MMIQVPVFYGKSEAQLELGTTVHEGRPDLEASWVRVRCPLGCDSWLAKYNIRPTGRVVRIVHPLTVEHDGEAVVDELPKNLDAVYCPECKVTFYQPITGSAE